MRHSTWLYHSYDVYSLCYGQIQAIEIPWVHVLYTGE